jgi:hypothetical protein
VVDIHCFKRLVMHKRNVINQEFPTVIRSKVLKNDRGRVSVT